VLFFVPRIKTITTTELAEKLSAGSVALIDVREPYEFKAGHVPKAVNIPLGQLGASVDKLDPQEETLVICQSGHRSMRGAKLLAKAGFANVASVAGGTSAWTGKLKR